MKAVLLCLVMMACPLLGAVTLINESFDTDLPGSWSMDPSYYLNFWHWWGSSYAGGNSGEMLFEPGAGETGTFRLLTPAFDSRQVYDMTLNFRQALDGFYFEESYTISVEISNNLTDWTSLWSVTPAADITATSVSVPIGFSLGQSETTYLAFTISGYIYFLEYWSIDNVSLNYYQTLGTGTWPAGNYYPPAGIIVPDGHTLTLAAGAHICFIEDAPLQVEGRLLAQGTASQPVVLSAVDTENGWWGVRFEYVNPSNDSSLVEHAIVEYCHSPGLVLQVSDKVRISDSVLRHNDASGTYGGGIYAMDSDFVMKNCELYDNLAGSSGSAIFAFNSNATITGNLIYSNLSPASTPCTVYLSSCSAICFCGNQLSGNYCMAGGSALYILNTNGTFQRNLINNNQANGICVAGSSNPTLLNCDINYNGENGIVLWAACTTTNCILWGNAQYSIQNNTSTTVRFSCLPLGSISFPFMCTAINCINADPLFINPTSGSGISDWDFSRDWTLQDLSPCIDAADPAFPPNQDGSKEDIGMYYRLLKPKITRAWDFSPDQGHQLDLQWQRNDKDYSYDPHAFYDIWRSEIPRSADALFINSHSELTPELRFSGRNIYLRDGERTWYYLNIQVPARMFETYGVLVPTPQDSSSAGYHAYDYMVNYCNDTWFWSSIPVSGYSVDNIPPYAARNLVITHLEEDRFSLTWDEVTEGGWEGNSYPEVNLITYEIYAGETPDFEISPSTFLLSTTEPSAFLISQADRHRFFKIIASDSE